MNKKTFKEQFPGLLIYQVTDDVILWKTDRSTEFFEEKVCTCEDIKKYCLDKNKVKEAITKLTLREFEDIDLKEVSITKNGFEPQFSGKSRKIIEADKLLKESELE